MNSRFVKPKHSNTRFSHDKRFLSVVNNKTLLFGIFGKAEAAFPRAKKVFPKQLINRLMTSMVFGLCNKFHPRLHDNSEATVKVHQRQTGWLGLFLLPQR